MNPDKFPNSPPSNPMNFFCPACKKSLNADYACQSGHTYRVEDGVFVLLDNGFEQKLRAFTIEFQKLREKENKRILDPAVYLKLPGASEVRNNPEWRQRSYDLSIIRKLLKNHPRLTILEIGAWNGWLSNRLAAMGHDVTAVDYFADPFDGLGAKKHYPTDWAAIQMNLEDLEVLDSTFDIVILNRCVQFFVNPPKYAEMARRKITKGGMMFLTGLAFFRNPENKIADVNNLHAHFKAHGFSNFKPIKGYLDFNDKREMNKLGIRLFQYPRLRAFNLKSLIVPSSPQHYYGVWP